MTNIPNFEESNPISVIADLATEYEWEFDLVSEDQITFSYQGQWCIYYVTLTWSACDSTLSLVCAHEAKFSEDKLLSLFALFNKVNKSLLAGCFVYWPKDGLLVYNYDLILGDQILAPEQVDFMMNNAIQQCDQFYPAFQLVAEGQTNIDEAYKCALGKTYGRA